MSGGALDLRRKWLRLAWWNTCVRLAQVLEAVFTKSDDRLASVVKMLHVSFSFSSVVTVQHKCILAVVVVPNR